MLSPPPKLIDKLDNSDFMKFLRRNPRYAWIFVGLCMCFAISYPNIKANWEGMSQLQAATRENTQKAWKLKASEQAADEQAKIAEQRYKDGCLVIVSTKNPNNYTTLTEGEPVYDRTRNVPLPVGTKVCDRYGNTGKIVEGQDGTPVVGELAFTGNSEVIALVGRKSRARYSPPQQ
jgi:hypothetical protein